MKNIKTLKYMAHEKFKDLPQFSNHAFPVTRRDFIRLGLIAGGGMLFPSVLPFKSKANASNNVSRIPFLTFDLSGGASLFGNFLVGKKGGPEDLALNNQLNGWDPRLSRSLDKTFGIPMSALESGILRGLKETLPSHLLASGQRHFKMSTHLHYSLDDQPVNKTSALSYISKSGLQGTLVTNGIGHVASLSGGNASALLNDMAYKPRIVTNLNDILRLTSLGEGFDSLSRQAKEQLLEILKQKAGEKHAQSYNQLQKFGSLHEKGNPLNDPIMTQLYDLDNDTEVLRAAIVLNVLKKYTGPGVITFEGCDYHVGNREDGDAKDLEIGRAIGTAIHAADLNKVPLFFQIITDGGMTAQGFNRIWVADASNRAMTVLGYFNPNKPVEQIKLQLGHVSNDAETVTSNPISATADKGAISTLVNYLAVNNDLAALEKIFSRMSVQEIDELLVFA